MSKTKNYCITLFALVAILSISCKKKESSTPYSSVPRITSISYFFGSQLTTEIFTTYDAQGKCIKTSNINGSYQLFEYSGANIMGKGYNSANIQISTGTDNLNAKGFISTQTYKDSANDIVVNYFYDLDDHLIREEAAMVGLGTYITNYTWSGGNLVSSVISKDNAVLQTIGYTFYTDKLNTVDIYRGLRGKQNLNLVSTELPNPNNYSHSYEFDLLNRVTKDKLMDGSGHTISTTVYTYL